MPGSFPLFAVIAVETNTLIGSLSATTRGRETWIADGWFGYLRSQERIFGGRWNRAGERWAFGLEDVRHLDEFSPEREWEVLEGYWGERAEIVLDRGRRWERTHFVPRSEFDHGHCAICWQAIGPGGEAEAFLNGESTWVCARCHHEFVTPRSLDFIAG